MAFYNNHIDGVALLSGSGPCASFGANSNANMRAPGQCWVPENFTVDPQTHDYKTNGYKSKEVFISVGTEDKQIYDLVQAQVNWHRDTVQANVNFTQYEGFGHAYSNMLPDNGFNENGTCMNPENGTLDGGQFNCGQDMAYDFLNWILLEDGDEIVPPALANGSWSDHGKLYQLDLSQITNTNDIANYTFIYVPNYCNNTGLMKNMEPLRCKFHIHFHAEN